MKIVVTSFIVLVVVLVGSFFVVFDPFVVEMEEGLTENER